MKKIPTMYVRDELQRSRPVTDVIKPECSWVESGEGVATRKFDGTNVKIQDGKLLKRQKPKEGEYDEASYIDANRSDPSDKYIFEAFDWWIDICKDTISPDGIFEAVGPKIQGNPEKADRHYLVRIWPGNISDSFLLENVPRDFKGLREYLEKHNVEGIVFQHPDGSMAKIKCRDFGIKRGLLRRER